MPAVRIAMDGGEVDEHRGPPLRLPILVVVQIGEPVPMPTDGAQRAKGERRVGLMCGDPGQRRDALLNCRQQHGVPPSVAFRHVEVDVLGIVDLRRTVTKALARETSKRGGLCGTHEVWYGKDPVLLRLLRPVSLG